MDENDDEDQEQPLAGVEWPTERVRIVGAEPAAVLAGDQPADPGGDTDDPADREQRYLGFVHHASPPPPPMPPPPLDSGELAAASPELPHWADPPTGQVPAIIDRRSDEDEDEAWAAFAHSGPVWREHDHEWEDTRGYEPSMLADDETPMGALDESRASGERRPWEFDDLGRSDAEDDEGIDDLGRGVLDEDVEDRWTDAGAGEEVLGEESPAGGGPAGYEPSPGRAPSPWGPRPTDFLSQRDDLLREDDATAEHRLFDSGRLGERSGPEGSAPESSSTSWWDLESEHADRFSDDPAGAGADDATVLSRDLGASPAPSVVIERPLTTPLTVSTTPPAAVEAAASRMTTPVGHSSVGSSLRRPIRATRSDDGGSPDGAGTGRNLPLAVATGVVAAAVVLGCFSLGPAATVTLTAVAVTLAAAEAYAAFRRAGMHPATLVGLVATLAVMVAAYNKGVAALPLVGVLLVITAMLWYLVGADHGPPVVGISSTVLGFAWVGVLGSFGALLLSPSIYPHRHGVAFAFGAVVATVAADVGALAVGSWIGRHQLAPHVSPNKTWEGWLGGAVLAVAASYLITGHMHPWTPAKAAVLGAVVAVVAPLGDLSQSLIKRDLGLKDMGSLLPGHGGVLDRMDALLFVLPATYYLVRVLHLG